MTTTHDSTPIPLILLAAGSSTRMGVPKQLLTYGGRSLLQHGVETALASVCRPIVVVLGANADALRPELNGLEVHIVENLKWTEGISSSLQVGVRTVLTEKMEAESQFPIPNHQSSIHNPQSLTVSALLVMLCDQPFVTPELLNTLVRTGQETGKPIIACAYGGSVGVPALFDRTIFGELLKLEGAAGAKQILARHAHNLVTVPFAQGVIDVDTADDYARLVK